MLWVLRLWLYGAILILGWALISYALTRNRDYLHRAGWLIRWSGLLAGAITVFWLIARFLR